MRLLIAVLTSAGALAAIGQPAVGAPPAAAGAPVAARAVVARASLTDIEQQVMCVTCGVPLAIAESPQAERERAYIRGLIANGENTTQIKRELVGQYGPNVLALPRSSGFNLAVYLVPVALVLALLAALIVGLPRWRRSAARAEGDAGGAQPSQRESDRLDADLARYDR